MRQVVFGCDNISLYYLSPYTSLNFCNGGCVIYSSLTDVSLDIMLPNIADLFQKLKNGATYEEIIQYLYDGHMETNPHAWVKMLFDYRILE